MRKLLPFAVLAAVAITACADGADDADTVDADAAAMSADPDIAPGGEAGALPAGYAVRLDRAGSDPADFQVNQADGALHIQTGPAGILYDENHTNPAGDYTVSATFTEIGAPANHREAFGLIIGGSDLQGEAQRYTYFLVRADGSYLIKRRDGSETSDVSANGWNPSEAVNAATAEGDVTNELTIQVQGDQVHFLVNGTEVATHPAAGLDTEGIAGVRVNHNLNMRVSGFQVS